MHGLFNIKFLNIPFKVHKTKSQVNFANFLIFIKNKIISQNINNFIN